MAAFITMFVSVFLAELGDKTQLATMLFASEKKAPPPGAPAMLGVIGGTVASKYLSGAPLKLIAGLGFIAIGAMTVLQHYKGA